MGQKDKKKLSNTAISVTQDKDDANQPFLTVYVPTYQRPKLLNNCLYHLLDAKRSGIDCDIMVYDSSTDDLSRNVVDDFIKLHGKEVDVTYVHRDFENPVWKQCAAAQAARGQYFMYLADDDYIIIDNMKDALLKLKNEPQLVAYFATWQLWNDETGTIVCKTNDQGLNWITSAPRVYAMSDVLALADEVIIRAVCPEIFIMKTEVARPVMLDWRYPDEQIALFFLLRCLRFGSVYITNTPFYRYCDIRKSSLLSDDEKTQTHYGERLYKEAPFMTRFSREWFVAQSFREAGHDYIPDKAQHIILKSINFEYIQRLKGNGLCGVYQDEYQLAHRYLSTASSWNPAIYPKEELYALEHHYLLQYGLRTVETVVERTLDSKKIQLLGFVTTNKNLEGFLSGSSNGLRGDAVKDQTKDIQTTHRYFAGDLPPRVVKFVRIDKVHDLDQSTMTVVPLPAHRTALIEKYGFKPGMVIAIEDVVNTLRIIRERIDCNDLVSPNLEL